MGAPRRRINVEVVDPMGLESDVGLDDDIAATTSQGVRRAREIVSGAPVLRDAREKNAPAPEPYARGRELAALLFVAVGVFVTLAIASYDDRGGADWIGPVGARVAGIVVSA